MSGTFQRNTHMSKAVFEILGAVDAAGEVDESAGVRAATELVKFSADIEALTGKQTFAEQFAVLRDAFALSRDVGAATEKPVTEAIGTVLAWKASADQNVELAAKFQALEEETRKREVSSLVAEGQRDGKLTPKTAEYWLSRTAAEVKAYLEIAPRVIPAEVKAPATAQTKPETAAAANADGKRYEDMQPSALAALKKSDPELHRALRADWVTRGKPAGQLASAAAR